MEVNSQGKKMSSGIDPLSGGGVGFPHGNPAK